MNNDELRKRVAQELGYTVEPFTKRGSRYHYKLTYPNGFHDYAATEEDCWHSAGEWDRLVDAALTLPIGKQAHWLIMNNLFMKKWTAAITDTELHGQYHFDAANESLAVAICEAWLAYREGRK